MCTFYNTFSVCQLDVDLVNRTLDARSATLVSCYLPSLCTGFHCCVNVPDLNMSFSAYISVDPCNYLFTIGIEKFTFNKSLDHYTFGKLWFMKYFFFLICGHVYKISETLLYSFYRLAGPVNAEIDPGVQICISGQNGVFSLAGILKIMYVPLFIFLFEFITILM